MGVNDNSLTTLNFLVLLYEIAVEVFPVVVSDSLWLLTEMSGIQGNPLIKSSDRQVFGIILHQPLLSSSEGIGFYSSYLSIQLKVVALLMRQVPKPAQNPLV